MDAQLNVFNTKELVADEDIDFVVKEVFTRPDFIANAMFYYKFPLPSLSPRSFLGFQA